MRRTTQFIALLLIGSPSIGWAQEDAIGSADNDEFDGTVFIRHPPRLVYFADAPRTVSTKLRRAVRLYCGKQGLEDRLTIIEPEVPHAAKLICSGTKIRYFHAVNYRQKSNGDGFACIDSMVEADVVFPASYVVYFRDPSRCLSFYRQPGAANYEFEPPHD
jgi:hypothetical protein